MSEYKISENISYIKASNNPLSSDIGIIKSSNDIWLFDVGNGINNIRELNQEYSVVLSHFHKDHIGNINNIKTKEIYLSKTTYQYVNKGIIVNQDIYIDNLHIFNLPSSHSKGSLALEVDEKYCFVGDGLYCTTINGVKSYNSQILKQEIEVLEKIKSEYLLVSHDVNYICDKEKAINMLKLIYSKRDKKSCYITYF